MAPLFYNARIVARRSCPTPDRRHNSGITASHLVLGISQEPGHPLLLPAPPISSRLVLGVTQKRGHPLLLQAPFLSSRLVLGVAQKRGHPVLRPGGDVLIARRSWRPQKRGHRVLCSGGQGPTNWDAGGVGAMARAQAPAWASATKASDVFPDISSSTHAGAEHESWRGPADREGPGFVGPRPPAQASAPRVCAQRQRRRPNPTRPASPLNANAAAPTRRAPPARAHRPGARSGSHTENCVPRPGSLSTRMLPPSASTSRRLSDSPSPDPCDRAACDG